MSGGSWAWVECEGGASKKERSEIERVWRNVKKAVRKSGGDAEDRGPVAVLAEFQQDCDELLLLVERVKLGLMDHARVRFMKMMGENVDA